ncbi:NAD+ kinase [Winogradskyella epiphytica]|uniref:NAD kinase n=1 Tax=Winogradskyella epiphytica TaxID=262005 RepID=A0A2V4X646_9FLAO|nr:NAD kinase [Winogradskyella epiphytica]PYE80649.1 NAD+ kinase [Winogradskyella epiphytica]GGW67447.1 NAD kinase [Winogradskyella epiphytica]
MRKVAIYGQNYIKETTQKAVEKLVEVLIEKQADIYIHREFLDTQFTQVKTNSKVDTFTSLDSSFDLLISVGGDGTILRATSYVGDLGIPVVGINTGRLGFLATIQITDIHRALTEIFNGKCKISERSLLSVTTTPMHNDLLETNFALNEIAISRKNTTSMITVETHLNGEFLTSYWADGLILSTPTGSTGYSLSCGGPVIAPDAKNFALTPIAPHNLSARPLIIPDSTTVTLKVSGREEQFLMSLDSRIVTLSNSTTVTIKKAGFVIKMVELLDETFLATLRKKLLWGEDRRN